MSQISNVASSAGKAGGRPPSLPGQPPSSWKDRVYAAQTVREGLGVLFEVVPPWVPVAGLTTAIGTYYIVFRIRLFLSQWRIAERRRQERKFELLDNLRGMTSVPVGAAQVLNDDDDDDDDDDVFDDEEDDDDETAVSKHDMDEFRSSLGIRLPRDEDLLAIVEKMLLSDAIPDGWVLYRTTAGIIRFMNLNTQELFFFPPNKRKEKTLIESELKKRNREAMESRYNFSYEDEHMNSNSFAGTGRSGGGGGEDGGARRAPGAGGGSSGAGPAPLEFGDDSGLGGEDASQSSAFRRVFHYFLEKEQKKIEQDVARSRNAREGGGSSSPSSAYAHGGGGGRLPTGTGEVNAGAEGAAVAASAVAGGRQKYSSMTYRVVSSSTVHGGRGGS